MTRGLRMRQITDPRTPNVIRYEVLSHMPKPRRRLKVKPPTLYTVERGGIAQMRRDGFLEPRFLKRIPRA